MGLDPTQAWTQQAYDHQGIHVLIITVAFSYNISNAISFTNILCKLNTIFFSIKSVCVYYIIFM